jgi:hypothetical protein
MPKIKIGSSTIRSILSGSQGAIKAYLGNVLIWEKVTSPSVVTSATTSEAGNSSITWTIKNNYTQTVNLFYTISTSSTGTPTTDFGTVLASANASITVNGLSPNTNYYIHFKAVYDEQDSDTITNGPVLSAKFKMNTPTIAFASRTTTSLTFTVTNTDTTEIANISATLNGETKTATAVAANGGTANLTWTGLTPNVTYTTSNVFSVDNSGSDKLQSNNATNASGTTDKLTFANPTIAFVSKASTTTTSTITWSVTNNTAASGTIYYLIDTSPSTSTGLNSTAAIGSSATINITSGNLTPNTTYYLHVYIGNNASFYDSAIVHSAGVVSEKLILATPSIVFASRTTTSLIFTVTNNDTSEAVNISGTLNGVTQTATNVAFNGGTGSLTFTGLAVNTTYNTSNVFAVDNAGANKLQSANAINTNGTTDRLTFTNPTITFLSRTSTTNTSTITWTVTNNTAVAATVYYLIDTNPSTSTGLSNTVSVSSSGTVNITSGNLTPGTSYYLHVYLAATNYYDSSVVHSAAQAAQLFKSVIPTVAFLSATINSVTFRFTNNDTVNSVITATFNGETKSTSSISASATSDLTWTGVTTTGLSTSNVSALSTGKIASDNAANAVGTLRTEAPSAVYNQASSTTTVVAFTLTQNDSTAGTITWAIKSGGVTKASGTTASLADNATAVVTYTASGTELSTSPLVYVCEATATATGHSLSDLTTSGNGFIIAAAPTAALSVASDGLSLTATLTNNDLSAATADSVSSSNITGLSLGSMTANGGQTTDAATVTTVGTTVSFFAKAAVTNKITSANSNTASIAAASTPTVAFLSATTNSITFRFTNNDASTGTIYATFNGETKNFSVANGATSDQTWTGVTTTGQTTSNVYILVTNKVRSANATNATGTLVAATPTTGVGTSTTSVINFTVKNEDASNGTINYKIRNHGGTTIVNSSIAVNAGATQTVSATGQSAGGNYELFDVFTTVTNKSNSANGTNRTDNLVTVTPTAALSVAANGTDLTATFTNNDSVAGNITAVSSTNITGLITSGALNASGGAATTDACTVTTNGSTVSFSFTATSTGKKVSASSNTASIVAASTPSVSVLSTTFNSVTLRLTNNDVSTGTVYATFNGETKSVSLATTAISDQTWTSVTNTPLSTSNVYTLVSGKVRSANATNVQASLRTENPTVADISNSTTTVTFRLTQNDTTAATIYWEIRDGATVRNSGTTSSLADNATADVSFNAGTAYATGKFTCFATATATGHLASAEISSDGFLTYETPTVVYSYANSNTGRVSFIVTNTDTTSAALYWEIREGTTVRNSGTTSSLADNASATVFFDTSTPAEYSCFVYAAVSSDHKQSATASVAGGFIITATPTAALSVGSDGISLTATFTNNDATAGNISDVEQSNISGLITSGSVSGSSNTTDAATATAGSAPSFRFKLTSTNHAISAFSNTASLSVSSAPTVVFLSATINSVTFRFTNNDASSATIYATFNGETQNTGSIAASGTTDLIWIGVSTSGQSTSNVYAVATGKVRSLNGTNAVGTLVTQTPNIFYDGSSSTTTQVAFYVGNADDTNATISWAIKSGGVTKASGTTASLAKDANETVTYTASGTELSTSPLVYICEAIATATGHSASATATSGNGFIRAAAPTASLSVASDGLSLTATVTNNDLSTATASVNSVSSDITGLAFSGTMSPSGGQVSDSATTNGSQFSTFFTAVAQVTNKTNSPASSPASLFRASTPSVSLLSATTDSITFRFTNNDAATGTIYATFNGETKNFSVANGATSDQTWTGVSTNNLSTSNVYILVSNKIKSPNATNAVGVLRTATPSAVYNQASSSITVVAFTVTQNDSISSPISWAIKSGGTTKSSGTTSSLAQGATAVVTYTASGTELSTSPLVYVCEATATASGRSTSNLATSGNGFIIAAAPTVSLSVNSDGLTLTATVTNNDLGTALIANVTSSNITGLGFSGSMAGNGTQLTDTATATAGTTASFSVTISVTNKITSASSNTASISPAVTPEIYQDDQTTNSISFIVENFDPSSAVIYLTFNGETKNSSSLGFLNNQLIQFTGVSTTGLSTSNVYALVSGKIRSANAPNATGILLTATPTTAVLTSTTSSVSFRITNNDSLTATVAYKISNPSGTTIVDTSVSIASGSFQDVSATSQSLGGNYTLFAVLATAAGKYQSFAATNRTDNLVTATPTVSSFTVGSDGLTISITVTNNDAVGATITFNQTGGLTGLSGFGTMSPSGGTTSATATASAGATATYAARATATGKKESQTSLTSTLSPANTPSLSQGSPSTSQLNVSIFNADGSSGTMFYTIRSSSSAGTILISSSLSVAGSSFVSAPYTTSAATTYWYTQVYFVASGKIRSASPAAFETKLTAGTPSFFGLSSTISSVSTSVQNNDNTNTILNFTVFREGVSQTTGTRTMTSSGGMNSITFSTSLNGNFNFSGFVNNSSGIKFNSSNGTSSNIQVVSQTPVIGFSSRTGTSVTFTVQNPDSSYSSLFSYSVWDRGELTAGSNTANGSASFYSSSFTISAGQTSTVSISSGLSGRVISNGTNIQINGTLAVTGKQTSATSSYTNTTTLAGFNAFSNMAATTAAITNNGYVKRVNVASGLWSYTITRNGTNTTRNNHWFNNNYVKVVPFSYIGTSSTGTPTIVTRTLLNARTGLTISGGTTGQLFTNTVSATIGSNVGTGSIFWRVVQNHSFSGQNSAISVITPNVSTL